MARNIGKESLEQKIAKIEKAISKNREQYDRLTTELEELHKKQKAIQSEELLKAIEGSSKSYEEILDFIQIEYFFLLKSGAKIPAYQPLWLPYHFAYMLLIYINRAFEVRSSLSALSLCHYSAVPVYNSAAE